MLKSTLHILADSASESPNAPAFKVPIIDLETDQIAEWKAITYSEFELDVLRLAEEWLRVLLRDGIYPGSVVALCLGGYEYLDAVHLYSIERAGYVPHTFSRLPGIEIVKELLEESESRAIICASQFKEVLKSIQDIPIYDAVTSMEFVNNIQSPPGLPPLQDPMTMNPDEICLIGHTSGSTSGRPKLVRATRRWMNAVIQKARIPFAPGYPPSSGPATVTWMGNMCHMAQNMMMTHQILHGKCTVQPRKPGDVDEIIDQIKRASVTRLFPFPATLIKLFQRARLDPTILALLSNLECISTGGAIFPKSEEDYAARNNINVVIMFGSTEGGINLVTRGVNNDRTRAFQVLDVPGVSYQFYPISTEAEGQPKLLELVIRSDSIDCPAHEFRRSDDGNFHSGDLWEEVEGGYEYRGRDDDWIKTESALRCDTRAIEDHVRLTCGDLVSECVVVGYGRPSPALFVEADLQAAGGPHLDLKRQILKRIEHFNSQRLAHERIASIDLILVVPLNTLPRTENKGNVRRKAVEDMFRKELDLAYGTITG